MILQSWPGNKVSLFFLFFALFSFSILKGDELPEKPMVVIIPSYNNINWYQQNLSSVFMQNYSNYRVVYVDDCSSDGTADAVENYVQATNQTHRFTLCRNLERANSTANYYGAIHSCKDHEIAVLIDGDDWLYHANVLKKLNEIYSTRDVWYTHGRLIEHPNGSTAWCEPIPKKIMEKRAYRNFKHPTHLRTFYVWLYKKIRLQDFLYEGGFLKMTGDMAMMYPIAEMAEERHAFMHEVNYVYNIANPINDNKVNAELQRKLDHLIRNRPVYKRLEQEDIPDFMKND
jgi:glycosyltransferase involved in cell wall biosynthesis